MLLSQAALTASIVCVTFFVAYRFNDRNQNRFLRLTQLMSRLCIDYVVSTVTVACFVVNSFSLMLVLKAVYAHYRFIVTMDERICGQGMAYRLVLGIKSTRAFSPPYRLISPPIIFSISPLYTIDLLHKMYTKTCVKPTSTCIQ